MHYYLICGYDVIFLLCLAFSIINSIGIGVIAYRIEIKETYLQRFRG